MKRAAILLHLLVAILVMCGAAQAQPRKLLIVVMDRVAWQDLLAHQDATPAFWQLANRSAVAAMCVRTASGAEGGGSYLTLGAGTRVGEQPSTYHTGSPEGQAFNVDELVQDLPAAIRYGAVTGWRPGRDQIVHLGLGEAAWQNADPSYPMELGLLGAALRRAKLHIGCFGNADSARGPHREIVALAMDHQGRVAFGDVGPDLLVKDDSLASGYRTDADKLAAALAQQAPTLDVAVVDLGETSRTDEFLQAMPPAAAEAALTGGLARADQVLAKVLQAAPPGQWALLLLTPAPPTPSENRQYAAIMPVLWSAPGGRPGLLTSPSTRRAGIVVSTDIAATVLGYFGLTAPATSVGRPMRVVPMNAAIATLEHDLARTDALEASRRGIFRGFATYATVILWLAVLYFVFGERLPAWTRPVLRGLLLFALAMPAAALLTALWPDALSPGQTSLIFLGLSLALSLAASIGTRGRSADAVLAAVMVVALGLDLLTGERMLHWSTLSYSTAAGARFYGVGNEYAGAMMGAALIALAALASRVSQMDRRTRLLISAMLLVVMALVGWPRLGANFGMALSCAVGFGVFGIYVWRGRVRWADLLTVGVVAVVVAVVVVMVDLIASRGAGSSHVGLLVATIRVEGPAALLDAVGRKLSMSWTLLRVSIWSGMAMGAAAFFLMVLLLHPTSILEGLRHRYWLLPALIALVAGSVAAIVLNDSGILAAAVALLYGAGSLAYLGLGKTAVRRRHRARVLAMEANRPSRAD